MSKKIQIRNIVSLQQELLTVAKFQANAATGTFCVSGTSEKVNDGNTSIYGVADATNQYVEVDFGRPMLIKQYRQFGNASNNGDGEWRIDYWDAWKQAWVAWVPSLYTYATAAWYAWADGNAVVETSKIRLVASSLDGSGASWINELAVKF